MNIKQIRAARSEMESSIQAAIIDAMREFDAKTGMCPRSIYVQLVEVTTVGDREKRFAVGEVRALLEL